MNDKFLKDAILSTIAEIEGDIDNNISSSDDNNKSFESKREIRQNNNINNDKNLNSNSVAPLNLIINEVENDSEIEIKSITIDTTNISLNNQKTASFYNQNSHKNNSIVAEEEEFLSGILQKLNVLFEGLKSDKLKKREEKTELVTKYLQVLQLSIEDRLKKIK